MKKIILATCTFLSLSFLTLAQEGVHIGVVGGPQFSMALNKGVSDSPYLDYINTWGSFYGLGFNYHFSETVGAGIGFNLSNQSQKYEYYKSGYTPYDGLLVRNYLRIPVLLHFNSSPGSVMFKGFLGPQFSMLMGATYTQGTNDDLFTKEYIDANGNSNTLDDPAELKSYSGDVKSDLNSSSIGLTFGLGLGFGVTDNVVIDFGIRMGYDFTDSGNMFKNVDIQYTDSDLENMDNPTNNLTGGVELGITYVIDKK